MPTTFYELILWRYYSPLMTFFFLVLNGLCGHIFMPDSVTTPEQYRDLGAALAFPLISGLCFSFLPVLSRRAQASILEAALLTGSSMRNAEVCAQHVSRVPRLSFRFAAIAGSTIAISYMAIEGLLYDSQIDMLGNLNRAPLAIQSIYFFVAVILLSTTLVRITVLLTRFATRDLRIELFYIEELMPLADAVLWNTISISAALTLSPIFWLGRAIPVLDISLVLAVLAVTLYLLFFPIFKVRHIVSQRKQLALERIRDALKSATHSDELLNRRLTDSPKRLEEINNLVGVREEIARTKEFPISLPVGIRALLVVLIPPVSWVSASIVDWVVLQIVS
jgi:hypothetical protein